MNTAAAQKEIERLTALVRYYNTQYYQHSRSEISDYAFDQLLAQLTQLENQFPALRAKASPTEQVGEAPSRNFKTIVHQYPMLSLSNTYSAGEIHEFLKRIQKILPNEPIEFFCELKFDGVAVSLIYEQGMLKNGITRGDGEKGDDITQNVKTIKTIPTAIMHLNTPPTFEVRGEVFMPRAHFASLNKKRQAQGQASLANPRNAASGTLKMLDPNAVAERALDGYMYNLIADDLKTHETGIGLLGKWGFNVSSTYQKCKTIDQVLAYITYWETKKDSLPVDVDGIVIKINSIAQQKKLGATAKSPRWAIAYKYKPASARTVLAAITYQVGRTGAITPVAELQPIHLAGTMVKRASVHNANEIKRLNLHEQDTVYIQKSGEIIPKITGIDVAKRQPDSKPIRFITHCPACKTPLVRATDEAIYYCPNTKHCTPQIIGSLWHFVHRKAMNIDSIGHKTIDLLFHKGLVRTPADLYALCYQDLAPLEGFQDQAIKNLLQGIKNSKRMPFTKVLFGLGIRHVGETAAEKLAQYFKNIEALAKANVEALIATPEVGEKITNSVVAYFQDVDHVQLIESLKKVGVTLAINNKATTQLHQLFLKKSFVVSGTFQNFSRAAVKALIKAHGGKVLSAISSNLDYLLAGDNMGPIKLAKAKKLGIPMLSEAMFIQMIPQHVET